jgi:hypothetical protein
MRAASKRLHELDSLRGLLLVLMTVTHLPTRWRIYSHDFFGFVSAAEGFVFLSAFLTTFKLAPGQRAHSVQGPLLRRAGRLYFYHLLLVGLACMAALVFAHRPAIRNILWFLIDDPQKAVPGLLTLSYCPPLFDILPMYVLFLAATPFALRFAERYGYPELIAGSSLIWLAGQLGARQLFQGAVSSALGGMPPECFGAFNVLAWQLLWVLGLSLGHSPQTRALATRQVSRAAIATALGASIAFFTLRLYALYGAELSLPRLFDKWHLGPARLVNLACLTLVFIHIVRHMVPEQSARLLSLLGRASLPVFCAHIVLCLGAYVLVDDADLGLTKQEEVLVLLFTFSMLFTLAWQRQASRVGRLEQRPA